MWKDQPRPRVLCAVHLTAAGRGEDVSPTTSPPTTRRYDNLPAVVRFLIWTGVVIVALPFALVAMYFLFDLFLYLLNFTY